MGRYSEGTEKIRLQPYILVKSQYKDQAQLKSFQ